MRRRVPEVTPAAVALGTLLGCVLAASMTYAGLVIGFVVPVSAVAAIVGFGVLRGLLRRGSALENNINQTVASAITNASAGVIFTFPALLLMEGVAFDPLAIAAAAVAGAFLGTLVIIPLRAQMIDLARLRFPWGLAVAEILRSPGAGTRKSALLALSSAGAFVVGSLVAFGALPRLLDVGGLVGLPGHVPCTLALSLLAVGAGYITGKPGLAVLLGGVLACWVVGPLVVALGWVAPVGDEGDLAAVLAAEVNRPLGIGFLMGGALAGLAATLPLARAALSGLRGAGRGARRDDLSPRVMALALAGSVLLLLAATVLGDPSIGIARAAVAAVAGAVWIWVAGIVVAECSGVTGWSPISGMALLVVPVLLLAVGTTVGVAVLVGAAVCVAIGQGSDMVNDLKTGHLVGARPRRQQLAQLAVSWLGPIVSILTVYALWRSVGFGPERNPAVPAPQAATLQAMVESVQGGAVPLDKYVVGALVGGALTLAVGGGLGVMVGLSMYLPMFYVLPYGVGCLLAMASDRLLGREFATRTGLPVAAGLLVGDSLAGVTYSLVALARGLGGGP